MIEVGQPAPDLALPADNGETLRLSDLRGRVVVLYFYPKDQTSGCTKEAQAFRDLHQEFADAGAVIVGVSPDSVASHQRFAAKQALPFRLLADEDRALAEAFGVWQLKKLYGREYMGIVRSTFLIDSSGEVAGVWPKVRVAGHAEEVLEAVRGLA